MADATINRASAVEAKLLAEFSPPTMEQWREEVVRLLKGAPYDKKMLTATHEGITLAPIYGPDDVKNLPFQDTLPGQWPYLRGTSPLGHRINGWLVAQVLHAPDVQSLNAALRHDLSRGQNAIEFHLDEAGQMGLDADQAKPEWVGAGGTSLSTFAEAAQLVNGLDNALPLAVVGAENAIPAAALIIAALKAKGVNLATADLSLGFDPLGVLACKGSLPMALDQAYDELFDLTHWATHNAPEARTLVACGHPYHEAGGNAVHEIAFTLASALGTLRALESRGLKVEDTASRMTFRMSIGGHFFMEIAKLRALRVLWAQVVRYCGGSDEACKIKLFAKTGQYNKTQFDPHVNMLRATTEAFTGVVAGVDMLSVSPFDEAQGGVSSDLGRRIARNTQLILKEEAKLDHVVDLAGGSWAVESLTGQLMDAAWKLFQEVERQGGFFQALQSGWVQKQIEEVAAARAKAFNGRTDTLVGVNQYPNAEEALPQPKRIDHEALQAKLGPQAAAARQPLQVGKFFEALLAAAPKATLHQLSAALGRQTGPRVTALRMHRLAEKFETLRKAVLTYRQQHPGPQVFLANLGPVGAYMPRLDFTRGFFQTAGFLVEDQQSFDTPEAAAKAALASGAPIVVAVGLDDTYLTQVPALAGALKQGASPTLLVAGLLKDHVEAFKAAGVNDFIHVKSDVLAVLTGLAKGLEIL